MSKFEYNKTWFDPDQLITTTVPVYIKAYYEQVVDSKSDPGFLSIPLSPLDGEGTEDTLDHLTSTLPGLSTVVKFPCNCFPSSYSDGYISTVVMHLNDIEQWSRERIADWLDTLDVDLSFATAESEQQPTIEGNQ